MPAGRGRHLARWMVEHPNVIIVAGIVMWLAACAGVFRWAMQIDQHADVTSPAASGLAFFRTWAGWVLVPLQLVGLRLFRKYCDGDAQPDDGAKAALLSLSSLKHRRIHAREPVRRELLPGYALLGLAGILLGVLLSFWLAVSVAAGDAGRSYRSLMVFLAALAILNPYCGLAALRDVLFLWEEEHFIAGREEMVAAALAVEARRVIDAEAERERAVQCARGWPGILVLGGLLGGGFVFSKTLSETDGIMAFQCCAAGTVGCGLWTYLTQLRPRYWKLGRLLAASGAAAFVAFTISSWGSRWLPLVLGLMWGGVFGVIGVLSYVRRLRG